MNVQILQLCVKYSLHWILIYSPDTGILFSVQFLDDKSQQQNYELTSCDGWSLADLNIVPRVTFYSQFWHSRKSQRQQNAPSDVRFEIFTAVKIHVEVFWILTASSWMWFVVT